MAKMKEDDNFYGESNDHEKVMFTKSLDRLLKPLQQEGFREGVSAGKDNTFQKGFDDGYTCGFKIGMKLGYFNAVQKILQNKGILDSKKNITGFVNPLRGFCHLCPSETDKLENSTESSLKRTLNDIIEVQTDIASKKIEEKLSTEYTSALSNLELPLE